MNSLDQLVQNEQTTGARQSARVATQERKDFGKLGEIKALTALRFFGVFFVVIDHAQGAFGWLARYCETIALCQSVTFFFVLSGFVLGFRYLDMSGARKIAGFYVGRVARLWPIHALGIALLIALMPGIFKPTAAIMPMFLSNITLTQAAIPILNYFYSYNAPSWSSSTLLFLYAAFPILLILIRRSWLLLLSVTTCGVIASIALASYLDVPEFSHTQVSTMGLLYVSPVSRLFDFSLGMCLALLYRNFLAWKKPNLVVGTALELMAVATLVFIAMNSFRWRYSLIDFAGSQGSYWLQNCGFALIGCLTLVAVFSLEAGLVSRLFRSKVILFLGEISFCIYVLHSIFLVYGEQVLKLDESPSTFAGYLAVLFAASTLMWWAIEKPSRKLARSFCKKYIYQEKRVESAS